MKIRTLAVCAVLAASSLAHAQTHSDSFVYQGELMDMGAPADGLYDISFIVYDQQVGGSIVVGGAQTVPNVQVTDGRFETLVNFGVTGTVFDSDQVRWLNIAVRPAGVGGYTQITPRQRISPAPLANYALRSGTDLHAAYENGGTIFVGVGNPVAIRSSGSHAARLNLGTVSGTESAGEFYMFNETGSTMFSVERDVDNNGGGYLAMARNNAGGFGLLIDGNTLDTQSTQVSILGDNSMHFSSHLDGDSSVRLPINSINATEILNEAGVAETSNSSATVLTQDVNINDTIDTVTVNAPTDGYVFVIATAEVEINHVNTLATNANFGVSATTALPSNGDVELRIDAVLPSAVYDYPVTVQAIFPASAGPNTYHFIGDQNSSSGEIFVLDRQVSAIFVPTAYGSVARDAGINLPDDQTPIFAPRTQLDILQEQNAALQADSQRQQRELEEIRAMMQHMKQQLDQNNAQIRD